MEVAKGKEIASMRRIVMWLTVATMMVVMMAMGPTPALADAPRCDDLSLDLRPFPGSGDAPSQANKAFGPRCFLFYQ